MPTFLIVLYICGIFATVTVLRGTHCIGCPDLLMYLKTKTHERIISVVCFSCFKKFKCLGDVLDSVSLLPFATFEVTTFGCFYNLAQILRSGTAFFCSVKTVECRKYFFIMSAVTKKGSA